GGIAVEIDHVAGLFGGHGAGVHGEADVGLGEGRSVVRAVSGHGDEAAGGLLLTDVLELVLGCGLREETVNARLGGDGGGGEGIVAGDHHAANAHAAELGDAFLHTALDDVFQVDDPEQAGAIGD